MPRKCVCCQSSFREDIDRELLRGQTPTEVSQYCRDRGLELSSTSVFRHTKHIVGYIPLEQKTHEIRDYGMTNETIYTDPNPLTFEVPENSDNPDYLISKINRIYTVLLTGITAKSEQWSRGEGRFPSEEIRSLKLFTDMIGNLKGKRDILNLQNTFDPVEFPENY
ncbi:MAG: hypothetical protein ACRCU2_13105 [Planktothrix sp.]